MSEGSSPGRSPHDDGGANDALWNARLGEVAFAFVDLEMTGCDPATDRICEVAVHRVCDGELVDRLVSLVNPGCAVGSSVAIHGISDAMVRDAPALAELRARLGAILANAILIGHAVHFDLAFLAAAAKRGELDAPPERALDTRALAQRALRVGSGSLASLAAELNLPRPNHRAEPDVAATRALFAHLCEVLGPRTAEHLAIAQGIGGPARLRDDLAVVLRDCWSAGESVRVRYRVPGREPFTDELDIWAFEPPRVEGWLRGKGTIRALRGDRLLWAEPSGSPRIHAPPADYAPTIPRSKNAAVSDPAPRANADVGACDHRDPRSALPGEAPEP